jgi:hypothetical protein
MPLRCPVSVLLHYSYLSAVRYSSLLPYSWLSGVSASCFWVVEQSPCSLVVLGLDREARLTVDVIGSYHHGFIAGFTVSAILLPTLHCCSPSVTVPASCLTDIHCIIYTLLCSSCFGGVLHRRLLHYRALVVSPSASAPFLSVSLLSTITAAPLYVPQCCPPY